MGGDFSSGKVPSVKIPLNLQSTKGSDLNLDLDSASSNVPAEQGTVNVPSSGTANETSSPITERVPLLMNKAFYDEVSVGFKQYTRGLKDISDRSVYFTWDIPENNTDPDIHKGSVAEGIFTALNLQSQVLLSSNTIRDKFIRDMRYFLSVEEKARIEEISEKIDDFKDEYLKKIERLEGKGPTLNKLRVELIQFFEYTNVYRKAVNKELNEMETIFRRGLKQNPGLKNNKEFKKMINVDYHERVKSLSDQYNYLKKRIG